MALQYEKTSPSVTSGVNALSEEGEKTSHEDKMPKHVLNER